VLYRVVAAVTGPQPRELVGPSGVQAYVMHTCIVGSVYGFRLRALATMERCASFLVLFNEMGDCVFQSHKTQCFHMKMVIIDLLGTKLA
jgi:hypothetical protein